MMGEDDADTPDVVVKPVYHDGVEEQKPVLQQRFNSTHLTYHGPVVVTCPGCHTNVETEFSYTNGLFVWILVIVLLLVFFPLAWIPLCIDSCKDAIHVCPKCRYVIGERKMLN